MVRTATPVTDFWAGGLRELATTTYLPGRGSVAIAFDIVQRHARAPAAFIHPRAFTIVRHTLPRSGPP